MEHDMTHPGTDPNAQGTVLCLAPTSLAIVILQDGTMHNYTPQPDVTVKQFAAVMLLEQHLTAATQHLQEQFEKGVVDATPR
jgi:hypothetical protein